MPTLERSCHVLDANVTSVVAHPYTDLRQKLTRPVQERIDLLWGSARHVRRCVAVPNGQVRDVTTPFDLFGDIGGRVARLPLDAGHFQRQQATIDDASRRPSCQRQFRCHGNESSCRLNDTTFHHNGTSFRPISHFYYLLICELFSSKFNEGASIAFKRLEGDSQCVFFILKKTVSKNGEGLERLNVTRDFSVRFQVSRTWRAPKKTPLPWRPR